MRINSRLHTSYSSSSNAIDDICPFLNELPSLFAERLGKVYANSASSTHKKEKGQFFTPKGIADFMSGLVKMSCSKIKILDPGCGMAILSCSLIEHLVSHNKEIKEIELVVYETDNDILPCLKIVLDYLKGWLLNQNIYLEITLSANDFVLDNKICFEKSVPLFFNEQVKTYDIVISNPPYFKIPKDDDRAIAARSIVWGQPNIYSIFMMVAAKLLKDKGQLVFITPRSFTSGNYFRAFREAFFREIEIEHIHLFGSRTDAFEKDNILQETLILKGKKQHLDTHLPEIVVTHSSGINDIGNHKQKKYRTNELINYHSKEKIIHLPTNEIDDNVIKLFKSWSGSLSAYNIKISTGPVVSFRATKYLFNQYQNGTIYLVPLYQLVNTSKMHFEWPVTKRDKPQYIQLCDETSSLLVPNKNYILLRRFSAKDDKSRLVAAPYFADTKQAEYIGIENHLNYIYRPDGNLENNELLGLCALLNSNLFDTYFRTFNGNINVSATELREMPLPPLEDIKQIGNEIIVQKSLSYTGIDDFINSYFGIAHIFVNEQSR